MKEGSSGRLWEMLLWMIYLCGMIISFILKMKMKNKKGDKNV
jgi:hypothetical protein